MSVHFKNISPAVSSVLRKRPVRILVFKTNLRYKKDIRCMEALFSNHIGVMCWNVDQDDIDNVLRIETMHLHAPEVVRLVTNAGYCCEELPD